MFYLINKGRYSRYLLRIGWMCYNRVISLGGRVSLFSLTDSMFSICMAITRHSSRPWNTSTNTQMKKEREQERDAERMLGFLKEIRKQMY